MKKTSISDFRAGQSKKPLSETVNNDPKPQSREVIGASPMLSGSRSTEKIKKVERKTLKMPVTGQEIEFKTQEVIPNTCIIHPRNQRVQSLLSITNPKIAMLRDSLLKEGQREPALARWITVNGERVLQIIDGSRRRFACDVLHQSDNNFRLKVWVGQITDSDADHLAISGNDNRDDISPWELAQHLKQVEKENPTWSHEVIATHENISRTQVSNLLMISTIPIEIVSLLESPDLLKVNSGLQVSKLLRDAKDNAYLSFLQSNAPYSKLSVLAKQLKAALNLEPKKPTPTANRKIDIKSNNKTRVSVGAHRTIPGQYKVDLFDLTRDEYDEVIKSFERIFK